jgi:hypothetical protein
VTFSALADHLAMVSRMRSCFSAPTLWAVKTAWAACVLSKLDAEFLQGHFRDLRGAAVVAGKQENRIGKLPPRCIVGKPTLGDHGHQYRPSDVERLEQAVERFGKPNGRYGLMIVQTLSLLQELLLCDVTRVSTCC